MIGPLDVGGGVAPQPHEETAEHDQPSRELEQRRCDTDRRHEQRQSRATIANANGNAVPSASTHAVARGSLRGATAIAVAANIAVTSTVEIVSARVSAAAYNQTVENWCLRNDPYS